MQEKPWLKLPLDLLQEKELSLSAKVIYVYMLWRYTFFVKERQGLYFESQETVASACGVSRKTVNESVQKLSSLGWMSYKKNSNATSTYTVKDVFNLYETRRKTAPQEEEDAF